MELAIGALELQNSLYFSLFAGNCVGDRFAGDCFHHHFLPLLTALEDDAAAVAASPSFAERNLRSLAALHVSEDGDMRTFLGMVLGCLLTIGVVYVHDSMATSTVASGTSAGASRQIVNWDVAASEWGQVRENVRTTWLKLTANNG